MRESRLSRWSRASVFVALVGAIALTACSSSRAERGGEEPGRRLRVAGSSTSTTTDPSVPNRAPEQGSAADSDPPQDGGDGFALPTSTYPIPAEPAGGCAAASGSAVTVTLQVAPEPGCVALRAEQVLNVANATEVELVFVVEGLQESIAPLETASIGPLAGVLEPGRHYFWSPGHPELSGILDLA